MKPDSILARNVFRLQQKRFRYGAFATLFLIAVYFSAVLKPSLNLSALKLQMSVGLGWDVLQVQQTNSSQQVIESEQLSQKIRAEELKNASLQGEDSGVQKSASNPTILIARNGSESETNISEVTKNLEPICDVLQPRTDVCEISMDVHVDGNLSSVFVVSSQADMLAGNSSWTIRPYARKEDKQALNHVREWSVKRVSDAQQEILQCTRNHSVPAVLFSTGGYTGNHFHEFTDMVIPLYITSRKYDGEVQFLITDKRSRWIEKYQSILKGLSKYEIIDIDKGDAVHCFPSVTVGLNRHPKDLSIDPSKHSYSITDFRAFLRKTYSLKKANAIRIRGGGRHKKPRLLIISRRSTRCFTNPRQITKMARSLGYKVTVMEADRNMSRTAEVVNSCDVLMGVHGAALTNILFLPENAVLIQILPLGGFEWLATNYFGEPSRDMKIKYLEYKINRSESTLKIDPNKNRIRGWQAFKSTFLNAQNVTLNVKRIRTTLKKALGLLHQIQ
ncbi:hypothetical protein ACFX1W_039617 [Malus domestica]